MTEAQPVICAIDDDVAILEVIQLVLEDEGYQVITEPGQHPYQTIATARPDLVLLDIWMPGIDGRDISRQVKDNLPIQQQPAIVLMSAHSDIHQSMELAKADAFLEKPFGMDELIQTIEEHLAR